MGKKRKGKILMFVFLDFLMDDSFSSRLLILQFQSFVCFLYVFYVNCIVLTFSSFEYIQNVKDFLLLLFKQIIDVILNSDDCLMYHIDFLFLYKFHFENFS